MRSYRVGHGLANKPPPFEHPGFHFFLDDLFYFSLKALISVFGLCFPEISCHWIEV